MTWRELNALVEAKGLADRQLGEVHVMIEETNRTEDEEAIDIFTNALNTLTVANSCCR